MKCNNYLYDCRIITTKLIKSFKIRVISPTSIWAPCAQLYSLAQTPQLHHHPPHLGSYARALLVSQDRRRFFVIPWGRCFFARPHPFYSRLLKWYLKTTWTVFPPLQIFALCHPYNFLLHSAIGMNRVTMEATISKRRNSGYCMYILYGFSAGTFVLVTENQAYYKARPPQ